MLEDLKKEAMKRGMKLMTSPGFMKVMSDPRVMKAVSQAFTLRGRVQSEVDGRVRRAADRLNLATREDVRGLKRTIGQLERQLDDMERRLHDQDQLAAGRQSSTP